MEDLSDSLRKWIDTELIPTKTTDQTMPMATDWLLVVATEDVSGRDEHDVVYHIVTSSGPRHRFLGLLECGRDVIDHPSEDDE